MGTKVALIDTSKCIACRGCQVTCKDENCLPAGNTKFRGTYTNPPDLDAHTWTRIIFSETESGMWLFAKYSCMHCTEADCINICPVGAVHRSSTGAVWHDADKCVGCGLCVDHCPFNVPQMSNVTGKMAKCSGCVQRISNGMQPACIASCPNEAIVYGDRKEMLALAQERVDILKTRGYPNARIYGEEELGGLNRIYILRAATEDYGLPARPEHTASAWYWQLGLAPLRRLAQVGIFTGLVTAALSWRGQRILNKQKHTL